MMVTKHEINATNSNQIASIEAFDDVFILLVVYCDTSTDILYEVLVQTL